MRLIAAVVSVATLAALASCGDSTGPERVFAVSVTFESAILPTYFEIDSVPLIQCDVRMRAVAQGPGAATWGDGKFYFFEGLDRVTPTDSTVIPADVVQQSWGASSIESPDTIHSQWRVTAPIPFGVSFVYSYIKDADVKQTAPVPFTCGPSIPPGTVPPAFTASQATPANGDIESGDTLIVSYNVASPVGIWETEVDVTGACNLTRRFAEDLVMTATHVLPFVLPPDCLLGGKLSGVIRAMDAAGQITTAPVATFAIVDRTPPTITATLSANPSPFGAFVLGGDSMRLSIGATDNHALSAAFWDFEPFGTRDSTLQAGASFAGLVGIVLPDSSAQKIQVRAWSRDAAGLTSDTIVARPDSIRVIPARSHAVRSSSVIPPIGAMAVAESRGMLYAIVANPPEILGISLQSLAVTDTIPLPVAAGDIDVTTSGDSLVVTLPTNRAVGVIDLLVSPRTIGVLPLSSVGGGYPRRLRAIAGGRVFLTSDNSVLTELDLQTGADRVRTDAGANGSVSFAYLERSLDHAVLVVDGVVSSAYQLQRYDGGTDSFGALRTHGSFPTQPRVDRTGSAIALHNTVYDAALGINRVCETPPGDFPVALSPDGSVLYTALLGILEANITTGELLERMRVGFSITAMQISSDGSMLVGYDNQHGKIAVIDLP